MASHELNERGTSSHFPHEWEDKSPSSTQLKHRTAEVKGEKTKVRVSMSTRCSTASTLTKHTQRVFNFAQIFFFALTYMSSWETMAL